MAICDLADDWSDPSERAYICVVGAGTAGLLLATRLARRNLRVVLLESGGRNIDPAVQELNWVGSPAGRYNSDMTDRHRGLGGSSWSGCLLPINAADMGVRAPVVDQTQWPIELSDLDSYRMELEDLFSVGHGSYEDIDTDAPGSSGLLIADDKDFKARWAKYPPLHHSNLTALTGDELKSSQNLTVWLSATVTGFDLDRASGRLRAVTARSLTGHTLKVAADEFVFAAGTIESTRLLLWLDATAENRPFAGTNALGCYFQDQLQAELASVDRQRSELTNHLLGDRFVRGIRRQLHLELSRSAQESAAVSGAFVYASMTRPEEGEAVAKRDNHGIGRRRFEAAMRDVNQFAAGAIWRHWYHQHYAPPEANFRMMSCVEQLANPLNRIRLTKDVDALNVPRPIIEWEPRMSEEQAFRATVKHLGHYWERSGFDILCPLIWDASVIDPDEHLIIDHARVCAHPSGSTRMGTDPRESVVGPDLFCHAIPNLAIASASVFPTSGSAQPTFTLMQLALRLADSYSPNASTA